MARRASRALLKQPRRECRVSPNQRGRDGNYADNIYIHISLLKRCGLFSLSLNITFRISLPTELGTILKIRCKLLFSSTRMLSE